jgi:hypothetical protein
MNSVIEQLLEGEGNDPHTIIMRMRSYIGKPVFTVHANETIFYEVQGCTYLPISDLRVHTESMESYYERKHGVTLQHRELPAFICKGGNLIPPELTFFVETPTV